MYVFDTSPLSNLFRHFYRGRFPTLWAQFEDLVADGVVTSTREVRRELEVYAHADEDWVAANGSMFTTPTAEEALVIRDIYSVPHFRQNIEMKKIQKGGLNADPFVIAKAHASARSVVTLEANQPRAAKIPNICAHLGVPCMNLEEFMEDQGWRF
ncbi:PIN domain-containing protein [Palleronia sp. KMU-117]|uniref:PIN domain-containing protein n=1 Tax=Palleronia sp. KMU-117 TaxID=3434108 RepID=UPI003D72A587